MIKCVISKFQKVISAFVLRSSAVLPRSSECCEVKVGGFLIVIRIVRNAAVLILAVPIQI